MWSLQVNLDAAHLKILKNLLCSANSLPLDNIYQPQPPCHEPQTLLLVLVKAVAWHGLQAL